MKIKVKTVAGVIIGTLLVGELAVVSVLAFVPVQTIEVTQPLPVLNTDHTVMAGEVLSYRVSYCKHVMVQAVTSKVIEGPTVYALAQLTSNLPSGCHTSDSKSTIIPPGVAPGRYRLKLSTEYRVNPLQTQTSTAYTEYFTVVAAPADEDVSTAPQTSAQSATVQSASGVTETQSTTAASTTTSAPSPATTETSPGLVQSIVDGVIGGVRSLL